ACPAGWSIRRDDGGTGREIQNDVSLEVDRVAEITATREAHRAAAGGGGRRNGLVDRRGVQGPAVTLGSECPDVVLASRLGPAGARCGSVDGHRRHRGAGNARPRDLQELSPRRLLDRLPRDSTATRPALAWGSPVESAPPRPSLPPSRYYRSLRLPRKKEQISIRETVTLDAETRSAECHAQAARAIL